MKRTALGLVAAGAIASVFAGGTAGASGGQKDAYVATLDAVPHDPAADNGSDASGVARLTLRGDELTAAIRSRGLHPGAHVMHIHGTEQAEAECPGPERRDDRVDDGLIDTVEGLADYGPIQVSFTTSGGTSAAAGDALDVSRAPVADKKGRLAYRRTFSIPAGIADRLDEMHIVIHGHDLDDDGVYPDGPDGSLGAGVPLEAEVPVACGEIDRR